MSSYLDGILPVLTPDEILAELVTILEASKKSDTKKTSSSTAESNQEKNESLPAEGSQSK